MSTDRVGVKKSLAARVRLFAQRPWRDKVHRLRIRWIEAFPKFPLPVRLPFGAWWLARNDHVSRPILVGEFENPELKFVRRFVRPGMTVLDIGAHHGFYTLLSSRLVGSGGRVIAFEPSPRERSALRLHVWLNRCRNVSVHGLALGSEMSQASLYVVQGIESGCNSLRPPVALGGTSPVLVTIMPLDAWLTEQRIGQVDFIKLDVEGGELEVLKGAASLLTRAPRPVVLAEVQDMRTQAWGFRAKDTIEYLSAKNYTWFSIRGNGDVAEMDVTATEFDGNFVACPNELQEKLLHG